jgi:TonB family protein
MRAAESWVLTYLLNSLWQIPLVFCAAWVASRMVRAADPRTEHRVWVVAVAAMAVLPACQFEVSRLLPGIWRLLLWMGGGSAANGEARILVGPPRAATMATPWFSAGLLAAIATAYVLIAMYFAGRLAWGVWRTQAIRRRAERIIACGDRLLAMERFRRLAGMTRGTVELAVSTDLSGPATVGMRHRTLLLPPGFTDALGADELNALLAHELAHMQRHDFIKNLLYGFVSLPVSYHPVLWLARRRVDESREVVCDAMAARMLGGGDAYARSLLRLASMISQQARPRILHAIGILDANGFERRIMHLTRRQLEVGTTRRVLIAAACGLLALATCTSALALRMEVGENQQTSGSKAPVKIKVDALKIVHKVPPVYPPEAKLHNPINGSVQLDVVVGKDGTVENINVAKSLRDDYDKNAIDAVRQWTFEPFLLNGDPIEVKTTINITYSLAK